MSPQLALLRPSSVAGILACFLRRLKYSEAHAWELSAPGWVCAKSIRSIG